MPAATGRFVHVFVDRADRRPAPVPDRDPGGARTARDGTVIVRGAVLREMGLPRPYAESQPLSVEEVELAPPGPGELLVRVRAAGPVPLRPVGDRRLPPAGDADGPRPRGRRRGASSRRRPGFAPGDHVVLRLRPRLRKLRPLPPGRAALCEPGAAANTAGTLLGGSAAGIEQRPPSPGRLRLRRSRRRVRAFGDQDRSVDCPPEIAALFGCAVLTGVGAVVNTAQVERRTIASPSSASAVSGCRRCSARSWSGAADRRGRRRTREARAGS